MWVFFFFFVLAIEFQDNVASSSGSNLRSSFIGMGFLPALVDKVIEEKGTLFLRIKFLTVSS